MREYLVPAGDGTGELVEKRSRFIGQVWQVESEEEARSYIQAVKKEHYDARHNCWCYRLKNGTERYSDDGEPQGTAGQPMLNVFQRQEITDVCCVVTRYFGGILLGAGGLVRAYTQTARLALQDAGAAAVGEWTQVCIPCSYALFERVKLEVSGVDGAVEEIGYGADISLFASVPANAVERLQQRLTELSAGAIQMQIIGSALRPGPREEIQ